MNCDYVPTMEEASETLEYEGSENGAVPEVQQWQDSAQYSPIVQTPTYGNAVASNYKVMSPCSKTPTLHASIESQAIKLHPPLQLGSATASAESFTGMHACIQLVGAELALAPFFEVEFIFIHCTIGLQAVLYPFCENE